MKESQGVKMRSKLKENYIHVVIVIATLQLVAAVYVYVYMYVVYVRQVYTHNQLCI